MDMMVVIFEMLILGSWYNTSLEMFKKYLEIRFVECLRKKKK